MDGELMSLFNNQTIMITALFNYIGPIAELREAAWGLVNGGSLHIIVRERDAPRRAGFWRQID